MRKLFLLATVLFGLAAQPLFAAPPFGVFDSVEDMEKQIGERMKALKFGEVLQVIDPSGRSLSQEQRDRFLGSLRGYFRQPLTETSIVKEDILEGGFRRAVYAWWTNDLPIYLYVVTHDRGENVWLLQYDLQTTFSKAIDNF